MQIQINTDHSIEGNAELVQQVEAVLHDELERFADEITRVEVHISDDNSEKKFGGDDKRCLLEARLAGLKPIVASHSAGTVELAVNGAVERLKRALESSVGKRDKRRGPKAAFE